MRIARKLFLLAIVATAATGLAAASASAQEFVTVEREADLQSCSAAGVTCVIHASGEIALVGHIFGIEATAADCNVEIETPIDGMGSGQIHEAELSGDATHNCGRVACGLAWPINTEEITPGNLLMHFEACTMPPMGAQSRCAVEMPLVETGDHDYELVFNDVTGLSHTGGAGCELTSGELHLEATSSAHDGISIVH
jgi:hypothetical protein